MRRSGRVPWTEVRVGVVLLFAFAVLMWAAFRGTGMTVFERTYELHAQFDNVGGLVKGAPVWLGGIEVGHVIGIEFDESSGQGKIRVNFKIKEDAWPLVSKNSEAAVSSMGLMGDKYLDVTIRGAGDPPAESGDMLRSKASSDLSEAFADTPQLMHNLTETADRLAHILERLDRGEGFLGRMMTDGQSSDEIDSLVSSSRRLLTEMNQSQTRLVRSVERASESFDSLAAGILHGNGTLSRLVWDTTLYVELSGVARRANTLLGGVESGEGTIGKLATDSSMYVEMRVLVTDMRFLIDDIMANPRKYFKFSIF